ncbi:MAG: hypothetical protein WAL90_02580 [Desulfobacterales bacterium]
MSQARPCQFIDPLQCLIVDADVRRMRILFNPLRLTRPGNRENVFPLVKEPCQSQLRRGDVQLFCNPEKWSESFAVLSQVLFGESRVVPAKVILVQTIDGPSQKSAAKRRPSDESDAQLTQGRQEGRLGLAAPQ